jgi:mannose-6-phosphate isomerase-like protein (cupin superfamily)
MGIRRVVTGHRQGKAVFVSDGEVEPLTVAAIPGAEFWRLWGADTAPNFPDDGAEPTQLTYFPPVGAFRFGIVTVTPGAAPGASDPAALAELEAKLPGLLDYMEPDEPGMHTTDTIDFEVVLSGELVLELDDGAEVTLRPGDTVVQNGTRHRWINRSAEPAQFAVFICGAHHARFPK